MASVGLSWSMSARCTKDMDEIARPCGCGQCQWQDELANLSLVIDVANHMD